MQNVYGSLFVFPPVRCGREEDSFTHAGVLSYTQARARVCTRMHAHTHTNTQSLEGCGRTTAKGYFYRVGYFFHSGFLLHSLKFFKI